MLLLGLSLAYELTAIVEYANPRKERSLTHIDLENGIASVGKIEEAQSP